MPRSWSASLRYHLRNARAYVSVSSTEEVASSGERDVDQRAPRNIDANACPTCRVLHADVHIIVDGCPGLRAVSSPYTFCVKAIRSPRDAATVSVDLVWS